MLYEVIKCEAQRSGIVRGALELVPDAIFVLGIGTAVIYDDVSYRSNACLLQSSGQALQALFVSEFAVQIVQLPR
jgi:hypothetical protein